MFLAKISHHLLLGLPNQFQLDNDARKTTRIRKAVQMPKAHDNEITPSKQIILLNFDDPLRTGALNMQGTLVLIIYS